MITNATITNQDLLAILDRADFASLTNNHLRLLLVISTSTKENPSENPTTIAGRMLMSVAAIGGMANDLVTRKLITRKRDPLDDRKVIFAITTKGRDFLHTILTGENADTIA